VITDACAALLLLTVAWLLAVGFNDASLPR
jgi:hypothetical protein